MIYPCIVCDVVQLTQDSGRQENHRIKIYSVIRQATYVIHREYLENENMFSVQITTFLGNTSVCVCGLLCCISPRGNNIRENKMVLVHFFLGISFTITFHHQRNENVFLLCMHQNIVLLSSVNFPLVLLS